MLLSESAGDTTNYVYGPNSQPIEQITTHNSTDTPTWLLTDQYGSIRATTDTAGAITSTTTY